MFTQIYVYKYNLFRLLRNFRYNFRLLDTSGWNFRHAHYHEEGRRTLYKAYGIKFVIIVQGIAGNRRLCLIFCYFIAR